MFLFFHNLGLFLLRLVTGALTTFFAARELAGRSDIILKTLGVFKIGSADIVQVFIGCAILFIGVLVLIGFWTRITALALLLFLIVGSFSWPAQENHLYFQFQALYGALFLYLSLAGGGNWAISRPGSGGSHSLLDAEQPAIARDDRSSIIREMDEETSDMEAEKDKVEGPEAADEEEDGEDPKPMDPLTSL
ncbi:MAG: hypothetical protein F7B06_06750 [Opitutae bacterium]|nr:hypothetical protein [Opitutae bacterium]